MEREKWFKERMKSLVKKMTSLAFITWAIIFAAYVYNKQPLDLNFLIFTAAVIGIKVFGNKTGGTPPATTGGAE